LKGVKGALEVADKESDEGYQKGAATYTLGHPYGLPIKKTKGRSMLT